MRSVEFIEVAYGVDKDCALKGLFRERIVANGVVGEVIEDFEGKEVAGTGDEYVPVKDTFVYNFDM